MKTKNQPSPFGLFSDTGSGIDLTKDGDTYALAWFYNENETAIPEARSDEIRAYLIRAGNSHAALVAALERARDHVVMSGTKCADAPEALAQISAALALAKL